MKVEKEKNIMKMEGDFKYGIYVGKGILYGPDGTIKYSGKFKNGEPDGCILF